MTAGLLLLKRGRAVRAARGLVDAIQYTIVTNQYIRKVCPNFL